MQVGQIGFKSNTPAFGCNISNCKACTPLRSYVEKELVPFSKTVVDEVVATIKCEEAPSVLKTLQSKKGFLGRVLRQTIRIAARHEDNERTTAHYAAHGMSEAALGKVIDHSRED